MVFGQCTTGALSNGTSPNPFIPSCTVGGTILGPTTTGQYSRVSVIVGYQYNFQSVASGVGIATDVITIATDVATPVALFSGLNGNNGIYWTATFTGTIRFYTHTSTACIITGQPSRQRKVIMAPFQAKIAVNPSLCAGSPGTGQYIVTVGPNHGWNSTSIVPPLTANNTNSAGSITTGAALPLSYNITYNGTSVNSGTGGSLNTNAEICPNCPGSVTTGTSTWSGTSTLTSPFTGYIYYTSLSPISGPTNAFTTTNSGPVGTYSSPANIVGNNASNQSIGVWPSGSTTNLTSYSTGCGAYMFYPTIAAPPNLLFNQSGTTIYSCGSGSITLSATGGTAPYNISWFNQASSTIVTNPAGNEINASGGSYPIPNLLAGTYTLTLTDANGCTKTINLPVTVAALNIPVITAGGATTFCSGGSVVLTASAGTSYSWSTGETTSSITVSTTSSPTVTVTDANGCSATSTATVVTVNALPTPIISAGGPITFCIGGSVELTASASAGSTFSWNTGPTTVAIAPTTTGSYSVTATDINGCVATSTPTEVTVNELPSPAISAGGPTTFCIGASVVLTASASAGSTFSWNTGPTTASISPTTPGSYSVTATDLNGCVALSASTSVTVNELPDLPTIFIGPPSCSSAGTATIDNYLSSQTYVINPSGPTVGAGGLISGLAAGTPYTVTSNNGTCTSLNSPPFSINEQLITPEVPAISIAAPTCDSDGTATISNFVSSQTYVFTPSVSSGPTVGAGGVISGLAAGTPYTVTSSNGLCNSAGTSFFINAQLITPEVPNISIAAPTCSSDGIATISNYVSSQTYVFTSSEPIDPTVSGGVISGLTPTITYTVTSNIGACASAATFLTVDPQLEVFSVSVDTTICQSNLPFSINSLTFSAAGTQVATLIAASNGCDSLVTINLSVIANVLPLFTPISPICFGASIPPLPTTSLNGISGTWSPAINNTDTTTYTFVSGNGQCDITTMTIIVYPQVLVTITDTSICTGGTATLIATATPAGGTYFWSNANPTSSITVSPTLSTSYSVFYTSIYNCYASATRLLAVNPFPTLTATSATICDGEIATIVATGLPTGGTYLWSPSGQITASINISPNTTSNYPVVYSRFGCASPQVIATVTVKPVPIITLASEVICIGEDITMTAQTTIAGGVYDWGNGNANETQTFSPLSDTTFSLSYSVNGCTSPLETAIITVNPLPISTFSASPLTGCIPFELTLLADDNSNTSYSWSADNGLTGTGAQSSLSFTNDGIYDITLTAGLNGCTTTTTINDYVTVDNYPIASFLTSSNKFTELIQLLEFTNTSSGAASYTWDFGDGASSTEINPEHNFTDNLYGHVITLTAYSQFLCESSATIEILFNNGLIYYIPNTFTPNGDEFNQIFKPIFSNNSIDVYNYSFYIYNRWEHVIFETHDVEKGWDGLFGEDGIPVPQGTYNYKIIVKFKETDERKEFFGHINLVR